MVRVGQWKKRSSPSTPDLPFFLDGFHFLIQLQSQCNTWVLSLTVTSRGKWLGTLGSSVWILDSQFDSETEICLGEETPTTYN